MRVSTGSPIPTLTAISSLNSPQVHSYPLGSFEEAVTFSIKGVAYLRSKLIVLGDVIVEVGGVQVLCAMLKRGGRKGGGSGSG